MTIEVVALNANGAGMAADSTVHYPATEHHPERSFTHADKIFDLSYPNGPVGVMINGTLQLAGSPLGAVLRLFPTGSVDDLGGLVDGLVEHLGQHLRRARRRVVPLSTMIGLRLYDAIMHMNAAEPVDRSRRHEPPTLAQVVRSSAVRRTNDLAEADAPPWQSLLSERDPDEVEAVGRALLDWISEKRITGLVLVGYDRDALFPQAIEIDVYCDDDRLCIHLASERTRVIKGMNDAALLSYSMDEDVRAFRDGIHPHVVPTRIGDYVLTSENALERAVESILEALQQAPIADEESRSRAIKTAALAAGEHVDQWRVSRDAFAAQLSEGLALFPTRMLPWAAKLQVEYTILRATTRPEMPKVGSPVSIAAVSRESGFQLISEETRLGIPRPRQINCYAG